MVIDVWYGEIGLIDVADILDSADGGSDIYVYGIAGVNIGVLFPVDSLQLVKGLIDIVIVQIAGDVHSAMGAFFGCTGTSWAGLLVEVSGHRLSWDFYISIYNS